MLSVAPVFVEYVLHSQAGLVSGQPMAQFRELREPRLPAERRAGLRDACEPGHWTPLAGDDHSFTLLDYPEQLQQVSLCLF